MLAIGQYESYLYLYILAVCLLAAIGLGILEKKIKYYGFFISIIMIILILGDPGSISMIFLFTLWQIAIIFAYFKYKKGISAEKTNADKWIFRLCLGLSILPLLLNKLSVHISLCGGRGLITFVGISYISFRVLQIIIEIHDSTIKELGFFETLYFILFFPSLTSGPIDRSRRFNEDINRIIPRDSYVNDYLAKGIAKIIVAIFYKYVIAVLINNYWLTQIPIEKTLLSTALYMYAYSLYLFFDFAGYSLFAIGTAYILGIKTPENFNKPFMSKDMKEFWTRWHISLSRWFGDYLFSRLALAFRRNKTFKKKNTGNYIAQMITMLTMGFWHGLSWYYIAYGLYQGLALVATDVYQKKSKFHKQNKKKKAYRYVSIFITFHIACFGLLIFSGYLDVFFK